MRKSSMANAKPPECNSISTTEVAETDITRGGSERPGATKTVAQRLLQKDCCELTVL